MQGMAVSEVQRKIAYYRRRIRGLERKYGTDFERSAPVFKVEPLHRRRMTG